MRRFDSVILPDREVLGPGQESIHQELRTPLTYTGMGTIVGRVMFKTDHVRQSQGTVQTRHVQSTTVVVVGMNTRVLAVPNVIARCSRA